MYLAAICIRGLEDLEADNLETDNEEEEADEGISDISTQDTIINPSSGNTK